MTTAVKARREVVLHGQLVNNLAPAQAGGKKGVGKHLQPGVVTYDNEDGTQTTYLLELDGIEAMRPTAKGIPIAGASCGFDHVKVQPGKEYDGKIADSFWDGESGWEAFNIDKMNDATAEACRDGCQFSCAYVPTETDGTPGKWHNVPYDEKILNGRYTHVAVVPTPRYNGATIELFNSIGGKVNTTLKSILAALMPVKALKELVNSIEEDEKKSKKDKAKADFDGAMKNAASDEDKAKAKKEYENAMAAVDQAGAADDAEKKNAAAKAERANKVAALRNAADAVEKAVGPEKAGEYRAEADKLEKLPLGGGDVMPDPGVAQAGSVPVAAVGPEKSAAAIAAQDEAKMNAEKDAAALALEAEKKLSGGTSGADGASAATADQQAAIASETERKNVAEAWNSYAPGMIAADVAAKVLIRVADRKAIPFPLQPADVQTSFREAYRGAKGATVAERCNSLASGALELTNAAKAKAAAKAKEDAEKDERFNAFKQLAEERGGASGNFPLMGDSMQEKAALGAELYGR